MARLLTSKNWPVNNACMTLDDALAWAGGTQEKLAARLGITQGSVSLWGGRVPAFRQLQLQAISEGALTADAECFMPAIRTADHREAA